MATQDERRADPVRQRVGLFFKAAREAEGLSQQEVARHFGISDKTVSAWEKGLGDPGVYRLIEIAKLYNVTVGALLSGRSFSTRAIQMAIEYDALGELRQKRCDLAWDGLMAGMLTDEEIMKRMPPPPTAKESEL